MRIAQKLTFGFVGIALLVAMIMATALYCQNKIVEGHILHEIHDMERTFQDLQRHEEKMLSSALEVLVQDQAFKDVFLEKDREKLYNFGQPLFQSLKTKYAITHSYVILPDEHCFVRLHNKETHGDLITRLTFSRARDTKEAAAGIELGKTAFALRVVMPYYNHHELIGYVELGEEIEHFLDILKGDTKNEFVLLAGKQYLDREKWTSVEQVAGLRDNWDDLKNHVLVGDTTKGRIKETTKYFEEDNLKLAEEGGIYFRRIQAEEETFAFGGFDIMDAGGRPAGVVLCLIDITKQMGIAQKSFFATLTIAIILIIMALGGGLYVSRSISRPITSLAKAASEIGKGNTDIKIETRSKDEIGQLAGSFNKMAEDLERTTTSVDNLNREITERKLSEEQLQVKTVELAKSKEVALSRAKEIENEVAERIKMQERISNLNSLREELLSPADLDTRLKLITNAVVRTFDADFARIWITNPGDRCNSGCIHAEIKDGPHVCRHRDRCLHLLASSGRYTHSDGKVHGRVPFGCYNIGQIAASEDAKFVIDNVSQDPRVHNHDWAGELGLVSFAGYRLTATDGKAIGVLALFSKHIIASEDDTLLETLASTASHVIQASTSEESMKALNLELIEAKTSLEDKVKARTKDLESFSYSVSHDLRAPLRAIDGFSKVLLTENADKLDNEANRLIGIIRENTQQMGELIDGLLSFSRLGSQAINYSDVDMTQLAEQVYDELKDADPQRNIQLDMKELPTAYGDNGLLHQVLVNLISNAIKYSGKRETAVIEIGCQSKADEDIFYVKDNGVGFDMEYADKLFSVFQRLHSADEFEGTGVGLALVQQIISQHGGKVWAQAKVNQGATFYFTLPGAPVPTV